MIDGSACINRCGNQAIFVEFGFLDGHLRLFQLRPFLDSASVAGNAYLQQMDERGGSHLEQLVDMTEVPNP